MVRGLLLLLLLFISGCLANDINQRNYNFYYNAGSVAENKSDLALAQMNYSKAVVNAVIGNLGSDKEAWARYEWARVTGQLGKYQESQKAFTEALDLLGVNNPDVTPVLLELGHLHHDNSNHTAAVKYYSKAVTMLDVMALDETDPIGYAIVLEYYAESLKFTGNSPKALSVSKKAEQLRNSNPGKRALYKPKSYK